MTNIPHTQIAEPAVTCSTCAACCCQLEVMLITDTGVPQRYIDTDDWGGEVMLRLDDGWCAALDRDTMMCTIYERRPLICREFEMGAPECLKSGKALPRPTADLNAGGQAPSTESCGVLRLQRHRVVQRVAFYTIVVAADPGVGIVRGANAHFMPAGKAQTETQAVFELEGLADVVVLDVRVGEQRHANPASM
jgi:Fe-S-cluster containining protein